MLTIPIDLSKVIGFSDISKSKILLRALLAELLGTFLLIFIGVASTIPNLSPGYEPSVVHIGFTFGLIVSTLVQVGLHYFFEQIVRSLGWVSFLCDFCLSAVIYIFFDDSNVQKSSKI